MPGIFTIRCHQSFQQKIPCHKNYRLLFANVCNAIFVLFYHTVKWKDSILKLPKGTQDVYIKGDSLSTLGTTTLLQYIQRYPIKYDLEEKLVMALCHFSNFELQSALSLNIRFTLPLDFELLRPVFLLPMNMAAVFFRSTSELSPPM